MTRRANHTRRVTERRPLAMRALGVFTAPFPPEEFLGLVNPLSSARQLRGVVTRVTPETDHSTTIHFRPGRGWSAHAAGQYARIGVEIDGVRQWRSYSLSAAEGHDPAITVTAIGGCPSTWCSTPASETCSSSPRRRATSCCRPARARC